MPQGRRKPLATPSPQNDSAAVLRAVAVNVRHAREHKGLTQQQLARAAGVSRRMLTAIEGGEANVSLATLGRIAVALAVPFAELIAAPSPLRAQVDVIVWRGRKTGSRARMLLSQRASHEVELWEWSLAPGEHYRAEPDPSGVSAFVYVVAGELVLSLSGHSVVIGAGGFYAYPCDQPYSYANRRRHVCQFVNNVIG